MGIMKKLVILMFSIPFISQCKEILEQYWYKSPQHASLLDFLV